jgi:hypothetical protein
MRQILLRAGRMLPLGWAAFLLAGCAGYHLGPAKPAYMKDVHTLAVPVFRSNALEPRLEGIITDIVIKQLQQDGTYKIENQDDADAVLNCTIDKVQRTPDRSVTGNILLTQEFDLQISIRYQLVERSTGRVLDSGHTSGSTSFFVSADVQQDEQQAIPIAAQKLAVQLTSQLSEGF